VTPLTSSSAALLPTPRLHGPTLYGTSGGDVRRRSAGPALRAWSAQLAAQLGAADGDLATGEMWDNGHAPSASFVTTVACMCSNAKGQARDSLLQQF
jgi:hypothetical protein